jgi:Na+-translocating ferredoxin:NAD+ oxidoreductase RNF subunit RnfB
MPYVIAEPCVATCDTACVAVCPVDCIHGPLPAEEMARIPREERATRLAGLQLYIDRANM